MGCRTGTVMLCTVIGRAILASGSMGAGTGAAGWCMLMGQCLLESGEMDLNGARDR